jgi:hypothetical protein
LAARRQTDAGQNAKHTMLSVASSLMRLAWRSGRSLHHSCYLPTNPTFNAQRCCFVQHARKRTSESVHWREMPEEVRRL